MTAPGLTEAEQLRVDAFGIHRDDRISPTITLAAAAEKVEAAAEAVRARLAPSPIDGQIKTPDEMIDDLEWTKYGTGQLALQLKEAALIVREARRLHGRKHAIALKTSDGKSAELREADALLACEGEQVALDVAETALEFAKNVARSIEQTGSMTQTQAGLVKTMYGLAGSGREH